ncbi:MAG TPA: alpha-amylase family glycosyl hydrolase, partial [Spirochaetota bacterium]|nr:alpha-amylase family glycosyl hydrolase [Spirochaetota bacterium]
MSKLVKLFVALTFLVGVSCSNGALLNDNQAVVDEEIAIVDQSASSSGTDIPYNGSNGDVMLQAFHWNSKNGKNSKTWYNYLYSIRAKLRTYYNVIYLPPPAQSADGYGYMPGDWANLNSDYGTQASLKSLISALHASPKKYVIADIVVNHRSAKSKCPHGIWCKYDYAANSMVAADFIKGSLDVINDSGWKACNTCMNGTASEGSWSYGGRTYYNEDFTG